MLFSAQVSTLDGLLQLSPLVEVTHGSFPTLPPVLLGNRHPAESRDPDQGHSTKGTPHPDEGSRSTAGQEPPRDPFPPAPGLSPH